MKVWPFPVHVPNIDACPPPPKQRRAPNRQLAYGPWRQGSELPDRAQVCQRVRSKGMELFDLFDGEVWRAGGTTYASGVSATKISATQSCKWRAVLNPDLISARVRG